MMRGLSVLDPACTCSCHARLTEQRPLDYHQALRLLASEHEKDRTTVFQRPSAPSLAFDLGEL